MNNFKKMAHALSFVNKYQLSRIKECRYLKNVINQIKLSSLIFLIKLTVKIDQVYFNRRVPTQVNTNQHKST